MLPAPPLVRVHEEWRSCSRCGLSAGRNLVVVGSGPACAKLMLVGEAPGRDEDAVGEPFVGQAGRLLRESAAAVGLDLTSSYITNVVACRPPGNRTPTIAEADACAPRLSALLWVVQPRALLLLGNVALQLVGGTSGITSKRGKWRDALWTWKGRIQTTRAMPTFHPAGLLPGRIRDPGDLELFRQDLRTAWQEANA